MLPTNNRWSIIIKHILYVKGNSNILQLIGMITNTSRSEIGSGSLKKKFKTDPDLGGPRRSRSGTLLKKTLATVEFS
jgi:hypothetical protein